MDVGAIQALATSSAFSLYGVDITIDPTGFEPVPSRGVWMLNTMEGEPVGLDMSRREPRKVLALQFPVASTITRGTLILAPDRVGYPQRGWRVDGPSQSFPDHVRFTVVADSRAEPPSDE